MTPDRSGVQAQVRSLHQRAVAATGSGRPAAGARYLRAGLRLLLGGGQDSADPANRGAANGPSVSTPERDALAARLLISLAHAEAEQGRTAIGLALLDQAEPLTAPEERGILLGQRGLLLLRTGHDAEALRLFDAAVPLLAGADPAVLARVILNRAVLHLDLGNIRLARSDLARCQLLAQKHGLGLLAAKTRHNLGYCDLITGDIPAALDAFAAARVGYERHGPGFLPVLALDKARALLTAGLAAEAGRELDAAFESFRQQRLSQDHAEAELARARAALDSGDPATARVWASRAERRFRRRGNEAWAAQAALMRLRAQFEIAPARPILASRAAQLAGALRRLGLVHDARLADLLGIRVLLAAGRTAAAVQRSAALGRIRPGAPLETRLLERLTDAELAKARGKPSEAQTHLRAGLRALQQRRRSFGSLDIQVHVAALGVDLANAGLEAAMEAGTPRLMFAWSERTRAQAFRVRPVSPPDDPETTDALAELRQLRYALRLAELEGRKEPVALRRCAELERAIIERSWRVRGAGAYARADGRADADADARAGAGGDADAEPTLGAVTAELGDRTMISFMHRRGELLALVIHRGNPRMVVLGSYAAVREAISRLLADLDALAGRQLPDQLGGVIRASVQRQLDVLRRHVLTPLGTRLAGPELVLVPTMSMSAIPWGLIPELRGRPVTVAPSAATWLAARRSAATAHRTRPLAPVLVAGPHLAHAAAEVGAIRDLYPDGRVLRDAAATVEATLRGLDGAPVAHIAAHGHHERENVLFSRLDLADGPLMAYDIQRLAQAPAQVVLSACDVGRTVVRPGDEILGFTAALLYAGTHTVVSSVARVPDDAAADVMVRYHGALAAGKPPASALADASSWAPLTSFVCFGSG
ncbi:MAG TPA: CHAT domain-containing protein [Actinomycetes bacterium]|nr:CHAT domain-containing protein [Actinomycetes bacterium]